MRAFLFALVSSLIFFAAIAIFGLEYLTKKKVDPVIAQYVEVEKHFVQEYLDDIEFLSKQKIFASSFGGRKLDGMDAGPLLNKSLHWQPEQPGFSHPPLVPADIQDFILRLGRNWSLHTSPFKIFFDRGRVDLRIFDSLAKYNYWDVEKNSPITMIIEENKVISPEHLPSIDSLDLIALAKLRYIEAIDQGDFLDALKDVRQLVDLLLTTENFRLELTAISILEVEHMAYNLYVENKWLMPQEWTPIDSNTTRRASRAIKATKGILRFWTPVAILKQVFLSPQLPIGFCSGVADSLSQELIFKHDMTEHLVFERDYTPAFESLEQIWQRAKSKCHLSYLSHLELLNQYDEESPSFGDSILHLPYTRKLFGLSKSSHHFEGFRDYIDASNSATN